MKIYLDQNDIGKTITYREENGKKQYLYAHDKDGFVFKSLEEVQNQKAIECLKEVKDSFCSSGMIFYTDCGLSQKEKDLILNNQEEDKSILADIIDTKIKELEGEE